MSQNLKILPEPCGNYVVGLAHIEYQYTTAAGKSRTIPATAFYPADSRGGLAPAPYAIPEILPFSQRMFRDKLEGNLLSTQTHCYLGAPVSARQADYPVILYNHGFTGYEMQNTVLCSDLASSGYVVFSISHPGESAAVRYADGQVEMVDPEVIREQDARQADESVRAAFEAAITAEDEATWRAALQEVYTKESGMNRRLALWVEDTIHAADYLKVLNQSPAFPLFHGKLRLSAGIGLTGHSFGGATAAQACRDDARFMCGINIDGGTFGNFFGQDIRKPFLTLGSEPVWKLSRSVYEHNSEDVFHLVIERTAHIGFTDMLFIARQLQEDGLLGEYDMYGLRVLMTAYHLRFFERYLLGNPAASMDELKFPGATLHSKYKQG